MTSIYNNLIEILGGEGEQTAIVKNIISVLYGMAEEPDNIPSYFSDFKNQITNLGSWLSTMRNQPLELDYVIVAQPDYNADVDSVGVFKNIWHNIAMFIASFQSDSNSIRGTSDQNFDRTISIWATTGKERADVKQRLIERAFVNQYQIGVNIYLVPGGALLPSIFAGKGPDIVMGLASVDIINYASRNALVALNNFEGFTLDKAQEGYKDVPGFNEITEWFYPSAFVPVSLEVYKNPENPEEGTVKNVYGLPEKQAFDMLFYRQDIMEDLGLEVPKTWSETYDLVAALKKRYMDFVPPEFLTVLYQNGGTLYRNNGYQINLDSETAIQAFTTITDYYTIYNCPKSYDFQNRFRFGEMPIGVQTLTFYSTVSIAAPEIKGTWTLTTVPGTEVLDENGNVVTDENGNPVINHVTPATVSSISLLKEGNSKGKDHANACWAWMQWWVSEDAQYEYGSELEATLGIAARYNTANVAAAQRLPWSTKELAAIMDQWESTVGFEEQVAGYYYTRYYGFAYNEVINEYADARVTLLKYIQEINKEIKFKREQLNLPYSDDTSKVVPSNEASN